MSDIFWVDIINNRLHLWCDIGSCVRALNGLRVLLWFSYIDSHQFHMWHTFHTCINNPGHLKETFVRVFIISAVLCKCVNMVSLRIISWITRTRGVLQELAVSTSVMLYAFYLYVDDWRNRFGCLLNVINCTDLSLVSYFVLNYFLVIFSLVNCILSQT